MKTTRLLALFAVMATPCLIHAQAAHETTSGKLSAKARLVGAWHLIHIDSPNPEGKSVAEPEPKGMLIYTHDGHMSVQLMYPKSSNTKSNEYVQDGDEASFGRYDVDEAKHTVTHHVVGSVTGDRLVGRDLPRSERGNTQNADSLHAPRG
ncbi:MAG: hypothetical protein BGO25_07010 [Acidobacteriales bacterium 59-55]|nr:lipocalin-like domain-containing protein [Terriglobales bacterium]OJV43133.1 MAG: hypothetical protein BGO25_07010 [Acidobacteriales bacterium 59-55]